MMDNSAPLVSVIIPCYNAENYVESAVRSMMVQTYTNLEILCCDDCSTDGTFAILQKLAAEDSRITLYRNESNLKIVRTLNSLVAAANGKYIARMDADDISLPKRIEKQVAFLERNPDYALCGTNAWHIDESGRRIGKSVLPLSFEDNKFFLQFYSTFYHPTVMLRSEIYKQNLYDENFLYAEDYELWARLVFAENAKGANIKEKLLKYRIFKNQSSEEHRKEQNESSARIFDKYSIVPEAFVCFHKNCFFLHEGGKNAVELDYARNLFRKLSRAKTACSFAAVQKLLLHIYRNYSKAAFLSFAASPYGLYACFRTVVGKVI